MKQPADIRQNITELWEHLETSAGLDSGSGSRKYRRLNLERETGVRVSCISHDRMWELLVEIGTEGELSEMIFPNWKGMRFELVTLPIPNPQTQHIGICLENGANRDVFATVCADLVIALDSCCSNDERRHALTGFLARWSRFFERHRPEGLSPESLRGLFGELWWLRSQIRAGINMMKAVSSWKGCERAYHDFEAAGHVVEVKTTMTKEPRRVFINNERQLDDRGLVSLHLLVLTLVQTDGGVETLPSIVHSLREMIADSPAGIIFENSLLEAGYLEVHESNYGHAYSVICEELFHVKEGFPRIITIPDGLGDIRYSLVVSAGNRFAADIRDYLTSIGGIIHE